MYESERDHRRQQYGGHYYGEAMEGATQRSQTRRYCHPVRPISIDPEWVFGLETNLEGFSQADEHALPPNYKPFEVLFQQPGPTTFKFRDEVFFNSRSGERYFMNRLWHNHPPLEVEKIYSVVPGYSPPHLHLRRHGPHCFQRFHPQSYPVARGGNRPHATQARGAHRQGKIPEQLPGGHHDGGDGKSSALKD